MSLGDKTPWRRGLAMIESALKDQSVGLDQRAYQKYKDGLTLCMAAVKPMPDSVRKRERQKLVAKYLTVAEELKQRLIDAGQLEETGSSSSSAAIAGRSSISGVKRSHSVGPTQTTASTKRKRKLSRRSDLTSRDSGDGSSDRMLSSTMVSRGGGGRSSSSSADGVTFEQVVGLEDVKQIIRESVIFPLLRPDLFGGLREPPKGLLLFGPPGNGKTFIAKAIANECRSTFLSVSASTLTSKFVGESEKQVKSLFQSANRNRPCIIFIDEMDSLLTARGKDGEQESSRRVKTEFLIQMDGITSDESSESGRSDSDGHLLVIGATNLPWEIDEAVLRRFPKRVLVGLPSGGARKAIVSSMLARGGGVGRGSSMTEIRHELKERDLSEVAGLTDGYSASDLAQLVKDAAMGPVRECGGDILSVKELPPIEKRHFVEALAHIKPCVDTAGLRRFNEWNDRFGTKLAVSSSSPMIRSSSDSSCVTSAVPSLSSQKKKSTALSKLFGSR